MTGVEVRELTVDDAEAVARATHASVDHLRRWMPWAQEEPKDAAWRREFIRGAAERGERLFAAFAGGEVVGCCGVHERIGPGGREIGYWVHAGRLRQGVATTMARRMVEVAFADPSVDHVEIHHEARNVASGRVPERLGFTRLPDADERGHVVWRLSR